MAKKKTTTRKSSRHRKPAAKKRDNRLEGLVRLQQRSIDRWTKYAVTAAKLTSQGGMSPGAWMKEYADLSRGVVGDVADLMRLVFPGAAR